MMAATMPRPPITDPRVREAILWRSRKRWEKKNRAAVLKVLRAADDAGRSFGDLREATGLPGDELGKAVDQLLVAGVIEELDNDSGSERRWKTKTV